VSSFGLKVITTTDPTLSTVIGSSGVSSIGVPTYALNLMINVYDNILKSILL
jgi:hypothetical protein